MGYNPIINSVAKKLRGYLGDLRKQQAHIIIPRNQVGMGSNDVGFENVNGKFQLHISEYDKLNNIFDYKKLHKIYNTNLVCRAIKKNAKYHLKSKRRRKDGRMELNVELNF